MNTEKYSKNIFIKKNIIHRAGGKTILLLSLFLIILLISVLFFGFKVQGAQKGRSEVTQYKYYTSIEIREGDTLWEIADRIAADCQMDTRACIEELKTINNLKSDTIHAGHYLTVFYYDTEYK